MITRRSRALSLSAAAFVSWGCVRDLEPTSRLMVGDSAGVTIYEAGPEAPAVSWSVSEGPTLLIGDDGRTDGRPLYSVRAGRMFDDGSFVIANAGSHEVRFYSADGVLERAVGREGAGPEEFRSISSVEIVGDSVWVHDVGLERVSILSRRGDFGRVVNLNDLPFDRPVDLDGILGDGSMLVGHFDGTFAPRRGPATHYDRMHVLRPGGAGPTPVGRFFRTGTYWHAEGERLVDYGRPFGRRGRFGTHDESWFYSSGEEYRVEEYDLSGELVAIYTHPSDPPGVRDEDLETFLDRVLADRERPTPFETRMRRIPMPARMPAYAELRIDHDGNVWARPHAGPDDPGRCWHVYQPRPALMAEACLPDRFTVLDIGSTSVLGVLRDELDVERVAVYDLGS